MVMHDAESGKQKNLPDHLKRQIESEFYGGHHIESLVQRYGLSWQDVDEILPMEQVRRAAESKERQLREFPQWCERLTGATDDAGTDVGAGRSGGAAAQPREVDSVDCTADGADRSADPVSTQDGNDSEKTTRSVFNG